jgi:hypothetical protein
MNNHPLDIKPTRFFFNEDPTRTEPDTIRLVGEGKDLLMRLKITQESGMIQERKYILKPDGTMFQIDISGKDIDLVKVVTQKNPTKRKRIATRTKTYLAPVLLCYDTYDKAKEGYKYTPDLLVIMKDLADIEYTYPPLETNVLDNTSYDYWLAHAVDEEDYQWMLGYYLMFYGTANTIMQSGRKEIKITELKNVSDWTETVCYDTLHSLGDSFVVTSGDQATRTYTATDDYSCYSTMTFPDRELTGPVFTGHIDYASFYSPPTQTTYWEFISSASMSRKVDYSESTSRNSNPSLLSNNADMNTAYIAAYYVDDCDAMTDYQDTMNPIPGDWTPPNVTNHRTWFLSCKTPTGVTDVELLSETSAERWDWNVTYINEFEWFVEDLPPYRKLVSVKAFEIFEVAPNDYAFLISYTVTYAQEGDEFYGHLYYIMVYHGEVFRSEPFELYNIAYKAHTVIAQDGVTYYGSGYVRMVEIEETEEIIEEY